MRRFEPCRLRTFCVPKVTSDGIEPPLSDLESEVLPLHHEAPCKRRSRQDSNLQPLDPRSNALPLSHATGSQATKTQTAGFEPAHAEHTRLAGEPRNHLGTSAPACPLSSSG